MPLLIQPNSEFMNLTNFFKSGDVLCSAVYLNFAKLNQLHAILAPFLSCQTLTSLLYLVPANKYTLNLS